VASHRGRPAAAGFITLIMLLSAIGVYIGRFGRWNSWDALASPWLIVSDLLTSLSSQPVLERFGLVVLTAVLFEALAFAYVYTAHKPTASHRPTARKTS
jgi:uncharacterized membrane protein